MSILVLIILSSLIIVSLFSLFSLSFKLGKMLRQFSSFSFFRYCYFSFKNLKAQLVQYTLYNNMTCQWLDPGHNERVQLPQVQDCPRHLRRKVSKGCRVSESQGNFTCCSIPLQCSIYERIWRDRRIGKRSNWFTMFYARSAQDKQHLCKIINY